MMKEENGEIHLKSQLFVNKETELARERLLKEIEMTPAGVPENLKEPIIKGVAFHHSGLTGEV